jgi:DNA-binding LacI/PurR family transcriptional regulator
MKEMLSSKPERIRPAYRVIEQKLRDAILSGELPYGCRLPAAEVLAVQFNTSASTIHAAMVPLMKSGLLERNPKRGTFVRGHRNQLVSIGIYCGVEYWHNNVWGFLRELNHMLVRELSTDGVHYKIWTDSRVKEEREEPLPELQRALLNKEVQGLIVVGMLDLDEWMTKIGIPSAYLTLNTMPSSVLLDIGRGYKMAVEELKLQGCASIGAIVSTDVEERWHAKDLQAFRQAIAESGVEVREEWVRMPPAGLQAPEFEQFGYHQFQSLWHLPERPQGLLVFPDIMARGVITSMLHAGVRVPDQLKVVLHRNENIPILCPFAASWLVTSVQQMALALIEQIKRQLAGKKVTPIVVNLALEHSSPL